MRLNTFALVRWRIQVSHYSFNMKNQYFNQLIGLDSLMPNGHVYETFGISESKPIKPLQFLLNVTDLKLTLSAKCFIYFVTSWRCDT